MIFNFKKLSGGECNVEGAVLDATDEDTGCSKYSISIDTIDDLMLFISKYGKVIISDNFWHPCTEDLTIGASLTIYDNWNE